MATGNREQQVVDIKTAAKEAPSETSAPEAAPAIAAQRLLRAPAEAIRPADILALQRSVGNRAIQGLLARRAGQLGARDANGVAADADAAVARAALSTGQSLPDPVRRRFERSLGGDLGEVRIHTGSESAQAANAVGAKAYTVGRDIHFGAGYFAPADPEGIHLLAHEVAHTVQNRGGAPALSTKLEVSNPADPAEIEAERAADAMVAGSSPDLGRAPSAIHRDDEKPADKPADAPPPAGAPPAPAAAAGDQVSAFWQVDWVKKQTGAVVSDKSNARTGKDAAYGTLKINPTDAKDMQSFKWVNAAPSGAVSAGTMNHPKDKGGVVSSDIAYGKPPSASAKVSVTMIKEDADKKDKPPVGQISAKQKAATAAVDAKLAAELADKGNIAEIQAHLQDAAVAAVGKAPEGYSYDVAVALNPILDPGAGHPKSAKAVAYDPFTADGKRIVTISVPTDVEKLKGNKAAEEITKDETSSAKQTYNKEEKADAHSDETTTTLTNKLTTAINTAFNSAWKDFKSKAKKDSGSISGSFSGKLDASTNAAVNVKDWTVDIGKLAALVAIENPPLALVLSKALGKATLGGAFSASLAGSVGLNVAGKKEWSDEEIQTTLSQWDSKFSSSINTEVTSSITTQVKNSASSLNIKVDSKQEEEKHGKEKKVASSSETLGVKFVVYDASISVTKG